MSDSALSSPLTPNLSEEDEDNFEDKQRDEEIKEKEPIEKVQDEVAKPMDSDKTKKDSDEELECPTKTPLQSTLRNT
jgi:hypothetical protein